MKNFTEPRNLFPYQQVGVDRIKKLGRCALFFDAGLGKTLTAIRGLDLESNAVGKTLIICPASLIENWQQELIMESVDLSNVTVMSYEGLVNRLKNLLDLGADKDPERKKKILKREFVVYSNLIVDESHMIRNVMALRSQAILDIQRFIKRVVFLTGTPTVVSNQDVFLTLSICEPGKWGTYDQFCKKFAQKKYDPWKKIDKYTGFKNTVLLSDESSKCCVRYRKLEIADQLPDKIESIFYVHGAEKPKKVKWGWEELYKNRADEHVAELRKDAASTKLNKYLASLVDRGINRGILFTWHKEVASNLVDNLQNASIITGDVTIDERYKRIADFQQGKCDWLVMSIASAGVGFNITNTNYVGFFEMAWTGAEIEQALSRAIRIGNKNKGVHVEYVLLADSIDEPIYQICKSREKATGKFLT